MNIKTVIASDEKLKEKYDYYCHLGYSEEASCVLSIFTYNSRENHDFVLSFGEENVLKKIYGWVLEADVKDMQELKQLISEKFGGQFPYDTIFKASAVSSGSSVNNAAQGGNIFTKATSAISGVFKGKTAENSMLRKSVSAPRASRMATMDSISMMSEPIMMEEIATDSYESIEEKSAKNVFTAPTSTFRMTTNTASVGIALNQIKNGRNVDMSQIRIEEILNYFNYKSEFPEDKKFKINTELTSKGKDKKILYINVQGKKEEKEHKNIVLLLDVSGSMCGNAETTQEAIATIVSKLIKGDMFSLITYSSEDETVFDSYKINSEEDKEFIMGKVLSLVISGCTYGSAGIETAYKIGAKNYDKDWNNQVILITDGDLNFGITKKDALKELIEKKKKENLFLSVIGTGLWNYKDDKLEILSKHGNGVYCVVNNLFDVKESIDKKYCSLTNIIAKDVKAQVEFNPKYVKEYRLLGYENRTLNHEDFADDTVISEPYGSGGYGVALYELTCSGEENKPNLKYQVSEVIDSDELCTVKVRYKEPLSDKSVEVEKIVFANEAKGFNIDLAYALYCISEKLRKSDKLDEDDKNFIEKFIKDSEYEKYLELNEDKLKNFIEYFKKV